MNWTILFIETIVLTLAFTAMILIPLVKNPVWWIADYPEDIQEEYFKTHERIPSKFFSPTVLLKKGMALLIALVLLLVVVKLAGAYDFWSALGVGYGIWLFIDWYDCFFLDWVLFANMKKVRLPGTEHMDEAYHQKKYHFVHTREPAPKHSARTSQRHCSCHTDDVARTNCGRQSCGQGSKLRHVAFCLTVRTHRKADGSHQF